MPDMNTLCARTQGDYYFSDILSSFSLTDSSLNRLPLHNPVLIVLSFTLNQAYAGNGLKVSSRSSLAHHLVFTAS